MLTDLTGFFSREEIVNWFDQWRCQIWATALEHETEWSCYSLPIFSAGRALHHPYPRALCTLPSFACIKESTTTSTIARKNRGLWTVYITSCCWPNCLSGDLQNSSYPSQPYSIIANYYSSKIFPRFWLVKTTHIIHHNQLLLTKYWTNDVKSVVRCKLLNHWRQNDVKSAARCRLLNRWLRKLEEKDAFYLVSGKTKSEMAKLLKNGEIFLNE